MPQRAMFSSQNRTTGPPPTTWSIVNKGLVYTPNNPGIPQPLGWTTGTGNQLVITIVLGSGSGPASVSSITDDASGGSSTYASVGAGANGFNTAATVYSEIWCSNVNPGATHMTINSAVGTATVFAYAYEVSGLASCPTPDKLGNVSNATGSGTNQVGASLSLAVAGDFIVSVNAPDAGLITGVSAGYTADDISTGVGFAHFTSNSATATVHQITFTDSVSTDAYETSDAALEP
jgi:hypothetical protein